jgi:hypothetical protein
MAWGRRHRKPRAARRAMRRATIEQTAELSSARPRGCDGLWRRGGGGVVMAVGGPFFVRGLGPAGRGGHSGADSTPCIRGRTQPRASGFGLGYPTTKVWADSTYFLHSGFGLGYPTTNKTAIVISKVDQRGMRQPRCAPSPRAFASDRISWEGSHNSIAGARRNPL